jgi:hypothetical protein
VDVWMLGEAEWLKYLKNDVYLQLPSTAKGAIRQKRSRHGNEIRRLSENVSQRQRRLNAKAAAAERTRRDEAAAALHGLGGQ